MRLLVTTIILTLMAQPVWAMTLEGLYNTCKPYADRGFKLSDSSDVVGVYKDGICEGYVIATIEQLQSVCLVYEWAKKEKAHLPDYVAGTKLAATVHGTSANLGNLNAVIQLIVNYAAANPEEWEFTPNATDWLPKAFPCKD